jgi:hypothetical protein
VVQPVTSMNARSWPYRFRDRFNLLRAARDLAEAVVIGMLAVVSHPLFAQQSKAVDSGKIPLTHQPGATSTNSSAGAVLTGDAITNEGIRLSNAPVVRLRLVLNLSDERSGISSEASESGRGGEAGWGV